MSRGLCEPLILQILLAVKLLNHEGIEGICSVEIYRIFSYSLLRIVSIQAYFSVPERVKVEGMGATISSAILPAIWVTVTATLALKSALQRENIPPPNA